LDYFRGIRPWSQLIRLADHLPPYSHYKLALTDDDDLQRYREARYAGQKMPPPRPPTLDSWTETDEIIAVLHDGFGILHHTLIAINTDKGKKPPKFVPARRPRTAAERAESRRDREQLDELRAKLRPKE
jgi:hypothetical protein